MRDKAPGLDFEAAFIEDGLFVIAGLDEAGRGAWAGPVSAGAVVLPLDNWDLAAELKDVRDSKLCTPRQREALYEQVVGAARASGTAFASAEEIDELGIVPATRLAMRRALEKLDPRPQALLIDGRYLRLREVSLPQRSLTRGELHSLSIAAASILAKVTRDHLMIELDAQYPEYGFAHHKGYGTPEHRAALRELGLCPVHRRSFNPMRATLLNEIPHEDRTGA